MIEIRSRITELFDKNSSNGTYSLFDSSHPLNIYLGTNDQGQKTLLIISSHECIDVFSSKIIDVNYEKRSDDSLALSFSLLDSKFTDLFDNFCNDVIENTYGAQESDGFLPVIERYEAWQKFFKRNNSFLSESEIKGLIGEILFLKDYLLPRIGAEKTINAYIGIENGHKDFELGDTWYEIKAVHNGASSVNISSLEQLDSDRTGHLEVVILDDGGRSDASVNLNKLIDEVSNLLTGDNLRKFKDKILEKGYLPNSYYDGYSYIPVAAISYSVSDGFPRLTKELLPNGVISAKYELSLLAIKEFKEFSWI